MTGARGGTTAVRRCGPGAIACTARRPTRGAGPDRAERTGCAVTLRAILFTDIEGSTALLQRIGRRYTAVLTRHLELITRAVRAGDGRVERVDGDGLFVTFPSVSAGVAAAVEAQVGLAHEPWAPDAQVRVRMGLHVGEIVPTPAGLVGLSIHHASRIAGVATGGQILVSDAVRLLATDLVAPIGLHRLGRRHLRNMGQVVLHQVTHPGLAAPTSLRPARP